MKKSLFGFLLSISSFPFCYSQQNSTVVQWDHRYGGNQDDGGGVIIQSPDSGYLLVGESGSGISGDKTEANRGDWDYWIIKVDAKGIKQWDKTYGGDLREYILTGISTSDGGFLFGGTSMSGATGDKTEPARGGGDYWIVKIDASGNKQWDKRYGGSGGDFLYEIQQTKDGGYILGGTTDSRSAGGDKTHAGWGSFDMWIVKIDSLGNKLWDKTFGTSSRDDLSALTVAADGGFLLAGDSEGGIDGDKTTAGYGSWDGWVIKTDSLGNKQWDRTFGSTDYEQFGGVEVTNDGGFILAGNAATGTGGNKTDPGFGTDDYWVVKIDSLGNKLWDKAYGGSDWESLWYFHKTKDKGFVLSGYSQSSVSGTKTENNLGFTQTWIVKIDSLGNQQWDKTLLSNSGYNNEVGEAIETLDEGYIVSNGTRSGIGGEKTEPSRGGADFWLVKLSDKYNTISGNAYYDFNGNQLRDSNDIAASYKRITETATNRFAFTNNNGSYALSVLDSGNFNTVPENVFYYNSIPYSHAVYFSSRYYLKDSLNDFAYQPTGAYNDLKILITPLTRFRPGREGKYEITYENVGTTTLSGQIVFICDSNFTFFSSDITPDYSNPDSAIWNFINLSPFQPKKITITVLLKTTVPTGTELRPFVRIEPVAGDVVPGDNYGSWEIPVIVTNSYDPNDKLVSRSSLNLAEVASGKYLEYRINFQNTGNDTAFVVKILDNISPLLDINTFEIVDVSHPMNIKYREASRLMIFEFNNILLPDSNVNENASHGFIRYRIKPLTTATVGNRISNAAAIYFDFNSPVITDSTVTQITLVSNNESYSTSTNHISIYPNPLTSSSTLQLNTQLKDAEVVIYDMLGKEMVRQKLTGDRMEIERGSLESGVYFVRVNAEEKQFVQKIIVQ